MALEDGVFRPDDRFDDVDRLIARVEELEAAIRLMCDGCESSGIAACQSCPLYPYRGGE